MNSRQIRQQFLDFFASKGHEIVDSSPVVPLDDPTLMFTNAGMNQFKDVFLGTGSRPYTRVADTQKCIRAGGKHNDLDDVGQDTYHHTFFEMLGNWSFGDYFKKEAIEWAWELLTEVWGIDKGRLHATYFEGDQAEGLEPDTEAAELWKSVTDIGPSHVHPGGKKDNFWEMGDTGPCGPCSEIHIDLTPDKSGRGLVNAGDPRVIELWNLVFIQFNAAWKPGGEERMREFEKVKVPGKTEEDPKEYRRKYRLEHYGTADRSVFLSKCRSLTPLPAKHVDTGMGFERLVAVLDGMQRGRIAEVGNYDTDVFTPIFEAIRKRTGAPSYCGTLPSDPNRDRKGAASSDEATKRRSDEATEGGRDGGTEERRDEGPSSFILHPSSFSREQVMIDVSYRVIADHVRCLTFALTDGGIPSNEGRGYVLRRILRRAVRYGRQYMNMHEPFMCDLVKPVAEHMAEVFPELRVGPDPKVPRDNIAHVAELIRDEEASFIKTLDRGIRLFHEAAEYARKRHHGRITGEDAFKLHDTYGFPIDLTEQMAQEQGLTVNVGEYERLMQEARETARSVTAVHVDPLLMRIQALAPTVRVSAPSTDDSTKYRSLTCDARVTGWLDEKGETSTSRLLSPQPAGLLLDSTSFYAEQGGQVGDMGVIETETGVFDVRSTIRTENHVVHVGVVRSGSIERDQAAYCKVDLSRKRTMKNHTSTHMLNWALREVLGDHVQQKGSLVDPEKTRYDFSHNKPLTDEEVVRVEQLVNELIEKDLPVYVEEVPLENARKIKTVRAVFGEKYADPVRVVSVGADVKAMVEDPDNPDWMKYPVELCGGTHLKRSSEAERFVLILEEGVAKGVRRLVGITGEAARQAEETGQALLAEVRALADKPPVAAAVGPEGHEASIPNRDREGAALNRGLSRRAGMRTPDELSTALSAFHQRVNEATIPVRVRRELQDRIGALHKSLKKQQKRAASVTSDAVMDRVSTLLESAEEVAGVKIVVGEVPAARPEALRSAIDWVRNKTEASAVLLATVADEKVTLIAGMSKAVVDKGVSAGDLIREVAPLIGGRGGGRPDMAQGGGNDLAAIPAALHAAKSWIREKLP